MTGNGADVWRGDGKGAGWGVRGVDVALVGVDKPDLGLTLIGNKEP